MKIIIPLVVDVDVESWANEYGIHTPHGAPDIERATTDAREQFVQAAASQEIADAVVRAWPALRGLARVTTGASYRVDDPAQATDELIGTFGLDAVAEVVGHRRELAAQDTVVRIVRAALTGRDYGPDVVPVAVRFDTMNYENGDYVYDGSADVFFSNGEDDTIEFDGSDADALNSALNPDGPCAAGTAVLVDVVAGRVETYEPHEHDGMAADLQQLTERVNTAA